VELFGELELLDQLCVLGEDPVDRAKTSVRRMERQFGMPASG
jgi:hypothetical protein